METRARRNLFVWAFLVALMICLPTIVSPVAQVHAASLPDLTVDSVWLEENSTQGQPVTSVAVGDQFLIVASIKNIGDATASGYYLDVYYDSNYGHGGPDTIAPGETQVWYVGPLTAQAGAHTTRWIVNPDRQITESNYDNEKDLSFTIESQKITATTTSSPIISTAQSTSTVTTTALPPNASIPGFSLESILTGMIMGVVLLFVFPKHTGTGNEQRARSFRAQFRPSWPIVLRIWKLDSGSTFNSTVDLSQRVFELQWPRSRLQQVFVSAIQVGKR
jgi:hypothetical protein